MLLGHLVFVWNKKAVAVVVAVVVAVAIAGSCCHCYWELPRGYRM